MPNTNLWIPAGSVSMVMSAGRSRSFAKVWGGPIFAVRGNMDGGIAGG